MYKSYAYTKYTSSRYALSPAHTIPMIALNTYLAHDYRATARDVITHRNQCKILCKFTSAWQIQTQSLAL